MKVKNITKAWLQKQGACVEAIEAWADEKDHTTVATLRRLTKRNQLEWANWLIVRIMTRDQYLRYAIYAAKQVLHLYEKQYPDDKRPREAIRAAERCLKSNTQKNKAAAWAAWAAAWAVAGDAMMKRILRYGINILDKER